MCTPMDPTDRPGDRIPGQEYLPDPPIRRRPIWTRLSIGAWAAFEVAMTLYFLTTSAESRPSDFVGVWVFGSGVFGALAAIALGMRATDATENLRRHGSSYRGLWGMYRRR
jgi:hypothetical protein